MEWAKHRSASRFDLAGSNGLGCSLDDLPGARDALALSGKNDDGYAPLVEAIAARYAVRAAQITNSQESAPARASLCASACLVSLASRIRRVEALRRTV